MYLSGYAANYKLVGGQYNKILTRISLKRPTVDSDAADEAVQRLILQRLHDRALFDDDEVDMETLVRGILGE